MGQRLLSVKGQKSFWSGVSRQGVNDRGQRRFHALDNCYVSQDGSEIRAFPGYGTIIDLTDINNSSGFGSYVPDAVRPVLNFDSPSAPYRVPFEYTPTDSQSLLARAKISHPFGFEQFGNEVIIFGESRFREQPLLGAGAAVAPQVKVTGISVSSSGNRFVLHLDRPASINSQYDFQGGAYAPGLNGLKNYDVLYVEGITLTGGTAADQAEIDLRINGRMHELQNWDYSPSTSSESFTLTTTAASGLSVGRDVVMPGPGEVHRVRPNRNDSYPVEGQLPYAADYDDRPDDPDALTCWRVRDQLDMANSGAISNNAYPCYPSWVANRQRDFGDQPDFDDQEGVLLFNNGGTAGTLQPTPSRGASRREQRRLPYRPNVDTALNRIILAVPQYGCLFQIPSVVPIDASDWKSKGVSSGGLVWPNNSIYDRPRALGIPKARLIDSVSTPNMPSPSMMGSYTASVSVGGSPSLGLDAGTYKMAISFEDPGTGDEGLASETQTIIVASNSSYSPTIRVNYIHPGYIMPECLALKMNVYLSPPNGDAMGFYGQFELAENPLRDLIHPHFDVSGWFGAAPCTPGDNRGIMRSFDLPLLSDTGDITEVIDASRLAPQSATMPRGSSACRFIRGVLFAGGAMGNAGPHNELWRAKAGSTYNSQSAYYNDDELAIRAHAYHSLQIPNSGADGGSTDTTLGVAGRCFPDAYQGIPVLAPNIFPGNDAIKETDRVLNRRVSHVAGLDSPSSAAFWRVERIRLLRPQWNRERVVGTSPSDPIIGNIRDDVHYVMPRGQLQVGDPGAPNRSSRAFIKIIDPKHGDDITALGQQAGSLVICTRQETHSYSWYRNPAGEQPSLMSNQFGCIASNSMVEFDGGLAWMSSRGPVALGAGLQHVGADIASDFTRPVLPATSNSRGRYVSDSQGMMRHSWGAHDAARGLVMWGLLRQDSTVSVTYEGTTYTNPSTGLVPDEVLSRFPCDEVLIWSYRANAFSHWRPPAGLEIYWMRPLRDKTGTVRTCFLAADNRIYALDDSWSDRNGVLNAGLHGESQLEVTADVGGAASTTLTASSATTYQDGDVTTSGRNKALALVPGMLVEFLDDSGNIFAETTIASITTTATNKHSIELSATQTWAKGTVVRIGGRQRMRITTTYMGAEALDTLTVDKVQLRYATNGSGSANAKVQAFASERGTGNGEEAFAVTFTEEGKWDAIGRAKASTLLPAGIESIGRRAAFSQGRISAPEVAVQLEFSGESQVRIQDINLEIGG